MCGIVGYIGKKDASNVLMDGLACLEYRGYDSAGIATISIESGVQGGTTHIKRCAGKLKRLADVLTLDQCRGHLGIGHTRWATHGKPTDLNAHPHHAGTITVVHNGIIENHFELRQELAESGRVLISETDTEIVAHLIDIARNEDGMSFRLSVLWAVSRLKGAFALAIADETSPDQIICVKQACPLVVGLGVGENFVASDFAPALPYTKRFLILEDGELAEVYKDSVELFTFQGVPVDRKEVVLDWSMKVAQKEGHRHFMHKEIYDQPRVLTDTLRGRFNREKSRFELDEVDEFRLGGVEKIAIVACGSSYYAGLIGKYIIEQRARIPVEVDLASEFRYRDAIVDSKTLVLGISQSGETADTLAALKFASGKGAHLLSICNVVGSAITRLTKDSAGTLFTRAGPEISVASTKAFVAQLMALNILSLYFALHRKTMNVDQVVQAINELDSAAAHAQRLLENEGQYLEIAKRTVNSQSMLFLGRGVGFPIALEGALKMKEISYIHAEGFAAGELKHGPIALIDSAVTVVCIALAGPNFEKVLSNMQEVKARGGRLICVTDNPIDQVRELCDDVIVLPSMSPIVSPIIATIPLQLLAYHSADLRGLELDQPRNLAKSVTVE